MHITVVVILLVWSCYVIVVVFMLVWLRVCHSGSVHVDVVTSGSVYVNVVT